MFERAFCDLGASVSVMPKNVFEKLRLPEPEPTAMCLDVLVKIGEHLVPIDFVIHDMGEGSKAPLLTLLRAPIYIPQAHGSW